MLVCVSVCQLTTVRITLGFVSNRRCQLASSPTAHVYLSFLCRLDNRYLGPGGHQGDAGGRVQRLLGRQHYPLRLQQGHGEGRGQEAPHAGTRPGHIPRRQAHLRPGGGRKGDAEHHPHPERRGHRQPCGKALVQERSPLHPQERGLHGGYGVGQYGQGQGRAGAGGEGVPRHSLQGPVPPRSQADALPRSQGRQPPEGQQLLPAKRAGQVPQVQPGAQRPGRQERPIRLLRVPVPHQAGQRGLRLSQAQRQTLRGTGRRQDSLQHPHRGEHHRPGEGRGRGDGRRGP